MAYNEKSKQTNILKYGSPCSLHGPNGVMSDKNSESFYKSQSYNRRQVDKAKKRLIDLLKENNIELLDDINTIPKLYGSELRYKCLNCGHIFSHTQRYKSPKCFNCTDKRKRSLLEDKVIESIKKIYSGKIIINDRKTLGRKEIDILLPDVNLGIEINGVWYHMINNQSHIEKYLLCKEKGINLIQIFDYQWAQEKNRIMKAIELCIYKKGCIYLNKEGNHNNQFPLLKDIPVIHTENPKKRFLSEEYEKCPKSQKEYFFIDCGASVIDIEVSKMLYHKFFC